MASSSAWCYVLCVFALVQIPLALSFCPYQHKNLDLSHVSNITSKTSENWKSASSVYDFTVKNIVGNDVPMEYYKGKVLIIVNVASDCGFTAKHYKELVDLDNKYHSKGLRILAFPCNQFHQEPGNSSAICDFVEKKNVQFDMFEKINVNGNEASPLWSYLKYKQGGLFFDAIKWNYTKFIVDRTGIPVERHAANVSPLAMEENLLRYL